MNLLTFRLDAQSYALPLAAVDRVLRAVHITPLPGAPDVVMGAIDIQGAVTPVLSFRRRFGWPERPIVPEDHLILARAADRNVGLLVDEPEGVVEKDASRVIPPERLAPGLEKFRGLVQLEEGLVLIQDLDRFFSLDEICALDAALSTT